MKKIPLPKPSPTQVVSGLKMVVEEYYKNKRVQAEEETKRLAIDKASKVELERIRTQREIMEQYLTGMFAERKQMIARLFDALDKGIDNGNDMVIQQSLGG